MLKVYEIAFSVCLATAPQNCKDIPLQTLDAPPIFYDCIKTSMPTIATWLEDHPQYKFSRIYCGPQRIKI